MNASERAMMIEHIMDPSMPNNLDVALDTADVIYDVQKQILVRGVNGVIQGVIAGDGSDQLQCFDESLTKDPMKRYAGLSLRKDHWPEGLSIGLEAQNGNAGNFVIGIVNGSEPVDERLRSMLIGFHAGAAPTKLWPWLYMVEAPYDRWTRKEALVRFHSGEAVKDLTSQLTNIVRIIDKFCEG